MKDGTENAQARLLSGREEKGPALAAQAGKPSPTGPRSHARTSRRVFLAGAAALLAACEMQAPQIATRGRVKAGLLLPSGSGDPRNDALAEALQNAAEMAASDLDKVTVELTAGSTAAKPEIAVEAAGTLASEGARILLGPVYSATSRAAAKAVAGRGLNLLSFSNNPRIAGGNLFILGITFESTALAVLSQGKREGRLRAMLVRPQNLQGEIAEEAVSRVAGRLGVALAPSQSYPFSQQGVINAVRPIAEAVKENGVDLLLFAADTAGALPILVELLPENGIDPAEVQFAGLTRWDIPPQTLALKGVQGGWFALPDPAFHQPFVDRFTARHGKPPHPIAGLAYDGVAAIGALAGSGTTAISKKALVDPAGFVGVNGIFRFREDGTNERGLAVATIRDRKIEILTPAPRSFADVTV